MLILSKLLGISTTGIYVREPGVDYTHAKFQKGNYIYGIFIAII